MKVSIASFPDHERSSYVYAIYCRPTHLVWNEMSWRMAFVKRCLPAIRNWKKTSLRREDLCRHTTSQWRWSESGAQTYTPRGPFASHSKNTLRGLHTCASLDQLIVLKLHLPQSIQSVKTKTLQQLLGVISNVSAFLHHSFSIIWLKVRTCLSFYWRKGVVLRSFTFRVKSASAWYGSRSC